MIFAFSIKLPSFLNQMVGYISSINTPVSMLVIGNSLANIVFKNFRLDRSLTLSLFLRNLGYPIVTSIIMHVLGVTGVPLATAILMMSCPVGGMVVLFTLQVHGKQEPAITLMAVSTMLSLITIPAVFLFNNLLG